MEWHRAIMEVMQGKNGVANGNNGGMKSEVEQNNK